MLGESFRHVPLAVCVLVLCYTVMSLDNDCETGEGDNRQYLACAGDPYNMIFGAPFEFKVTPESYTCGQTGQEIYCTLGITTSCAYCDESDPTLKHEPKYMFDPITDSDNVTVIGPNMSTWWQSISWTNYPTPLNVNITLHFNKTYELTSDIEITFQSSRPQHAILYKSEDYGATWSVLQYYSKSCQNYWNGGVAKSFTSKDEGTVICTTDYSKEIPYKDGVLSFPVTSRFYDPSALDDQVYINYETTSIKKFLRYTDLRLCLLYPATDGKEAQKQKLDLVKYYYGIKNWKLESACFCNLHGKYCVQGYDGTIVCVCGHNTEGAECERCQPLYNNRPWKPGSYLPSPSGTANECQKCQCYEHASSCVYSDTLGHGVCQNCTDKTAGNSCEKCIDGYFHNVTLRLTDPNICIPCNCTLVGVKDNITSCEVTTGQCVCREMVTGLKCDTCVDGYYGLLINTNNECLPCGCNPHGVVGSAAQCNPEDGQCYCKANIMGRTCNVCKPGYFRYPGDGVAELDCTACGCNVGGSVTFECDEAAGHCTCKTGLEGARCDTVNSGYYVKALDHYQYQPTGGSCERGTSTLTHENPFTGRYYFNCTPSDEQLIVNFEEVDGAKFLTEQLRASYKPVIRYNLNSSEPWGQVELEVVCLGGSSVDISVYSSRANTAVDSSCPNLSTQIALINFYNLPSGQGLAAVAPSSVTLDVRCVYSISVMVKPGSPESVSQSIIIDSVVLAPDYQNSSIYRISDESKQTNQRQCFDEIMALNTNTAASSRDTCQSFTFALSSEVYYGASECECNQTGTESMPCHGLGGQCQCKPGVTGLRCDMCEPGFFNFTSSGCTLCDYVPCLDEMVLFTRPLTRDDQGDKIKLGVAIFLVLLLALMLLPLLVLLLHPPFRLAVFRRIHGTADEKSHLVEKSSPPGSCRLLFKGQNRQILYANQAYVEWEGVDENKKSNNNFEDLETMVVKQKWASYDSTADTPNTIAPTTDVMEKKNEGNEQKKPTLISQCKESSPGYGPQAPGIADPYSGDQTRTCRKRHQKPDLLMLTNDKDDGFDEVGGSLV